MAANSTLQIEVVSNGIADAVRKLDSLGNAAGRVEGKIKLLTDSLKLLMSAQDDAVTRASQHAALMASISQQMGLVAQAAKGTSASVSKLTQDFNAMTAATDTSSNALQRKGFVANAVTSALRYMVVAATAYLSLNFAKSIIQDADGWMMMQAKLKLATGSMAEARQVQGELFEVAQKLRVPLEDIGRLYTRMAIPMQRMGKTAKETSEHVEFVSLALKLNGATAAEAASVMLQYSQSVNAGRLNGAEFNAVAEGAPLILRALEEELKATGKWSEYSGKSLKKMGSDGEISFDLMYRASQRALPQMREDFEKLPFTVDGAIQRIKNAWFMAMGQMGEDTGMNTKLAKALGKIEEAIPAIRDSLASMFLFMSEHFGKFVVVIEAIIAIKLIGWIGGAVAGMIAMAQAIPAVVAGMGAVATGAAGAATAMTLLRLGAAALAGPWGILIGLVGTAAVAAWQYFSAEAPKADAVVTASTKVNVIDRVALIQKEIDALNKRNGIIKAGVPVAVTSAAAPDADLQEKQKGLDALRAAKSGLTNEAGRAEIQKTIDLRQREFDLTKGQQTTLEALRKTNLEAIRRDQVAGLRSEMGLKFEDKFEKGDRLVKEWNAKLMEKGDKLTPAEESAIRLKAQGAETIDKVDHYKKLSASIKAATEDLQTYIDTGANATASEKALNSYKTGKNEDYNKMPQAGRTNIDKEQAAWFALEQKVQAMKDLEKATAQAAVDEDNFIKKKETGVTTVEQATLKIREQIAALTQSKTASTEMAAAELEVQAATAKTNALRDIELTGSTVRYDWYMKEAKALQAQADAKRDLGVAQDTTEAQAALDKLLDPKKALNFGSALKEAFGDAGGAIGKMATALGVYGHTQNEVDKDRKKFLSLPDNAQRQKGLEALDQKEEQSKLRMYGAMASGSKNFFAKHTVAYRAMSIAEEGFRAVELAQTVTNFVIKNGLLEQFSSMFFATETAQTAFQMSEHAAAAATDIALTTATETTKNAAKVPGVFMAFMSQLGPWGMAAAGVAIAAVLGGALGGGGGGEPAVDFKARQSAQGTGTILGSDTAKSESISNAMNIVKENSNIGLTLSTNMLTSLRGIEASMQGLASSIFKASGMTTGKNFGIKEGKAGGGIIDSIFGGATVTTVSDTGLKLNGTASDFKAGRGAQQYADVNVQESGGWFSSDSSSNSRSFMAANGEITNTIGRVFESINDTISLAATSLGANGTSIKSAMDAYVIDTEVSFKGLQGDDLAKALNNVFSATADGIARSVFPGLEAFQVAGEGYYQTVVRVSAGTEQAQNALLGLGVAMVGRDSLTNKTGDIGAEFVRQSVMAKEAGTTMADIMRVMHGSMSDLVDGYKKLLDIRDTMRGAGLGGSISMDTIRGAGGITELQSALNSFTEGFYTDAEKSVISFTKLRAEFGRLNTAMPETKEGFRSLVTTLMAGDAASKELAGRVLLLGSSFAEAFSKADTARKDAIEKAKTNLNDAYAKESDALTTLIDKMKGFKDALLAFRGSLITGDMSTKSSYEKYATAKASYEDVSAKANTGDVTAIAAFQTTATEFLKFSREVNASGATYTADYDRVLAETEALRVYTASQVDVATASLDALKAQVVGLIDVKESVMSVRDAIIALHAAMAMTVPGMAASSVVINGSHANGLANVPFDGYIAELHKGEAVLTSAENTEYKEASLKTYGRGGDADKVLCEEIKLLRAEIRQLKEEQREQTSSLVSATYDSNERNAQAVVAGTYGASEQASYLERTKTRMA